MTTALALDLRQQLTRLSRRRGGLVLGVWGDAGSGKTWTVREARRAAPIRSAEVQASWTPGAVVAALPRPARLSAWLTAALKRLDLDGEAGTDTVAALLAALAPFALHVEDLHGASPDARRWWAGLALQVQRTNGVGLVFTSREPPEGQMTVRRTSPLNAAEMATVLTAELGAPLPVAAASWIGGRSHGHPLFALEFLRFLVRQGNLYNDGQRWHWRAPHDRRLPSGIEALIAHQLRATPLPGWAQQVWETLLLCPPEVPPASWLAAGPDIAEVSAQTWTEGLAVLRRAGLLRGAALAHPLYREVALDHSDPAALRSRAARAVEVFKTSTPQLAALLVPAAGLAPDEATRLLCRGAEAALDTGQPRRAATFLTQALDCVPGKERAALALRAARLWRPLDPLQAGRLAREVLRETPQQLEATFLLAGALAAQGDGQEAARLAGCLEERGRRDWLFGRLGLHAQQHQHPDVLRLWQSCPQWHAEAPPDVLAAVCRALDFSGEPDMALALLGAALRSPPPDVLERCTLLMARCRAHYNAGQPAQAEADATAVIETAEADDHLPTVAAALSSRATIRDTLGKFREARADAERALELFAGLGLSRDHAQQQTRLACLVLEDGEYDRAEALLREGREGLRRMGASHFLALSELNLAYLYLEQCLPYGGALALNYAALAVHSARQAGSPLITAQALGVAARAEALHGEPGRALNLATEALALSGSHTHDAAWSLWALGFALEASGDLCGAAQHFRAAAAHLQAQHLDLWAARLGLEADRLGGDLAAALAKLTRFRAHGLHNWANVTRRYFPELQEKGAPPAPPAPDLHLGVLGPWQVVRGGQPLPFRSPLGRALLTILLEARLEGRPGVSPLALQQILYPHLPDEQAAAALHQLIYRTRQTLGPEVVVLGDQGYTLGGAQTDAETYLQGGGAALWRGLYLGGDAGPLGPGPVADRLYARLRAQAIELAGDDAQPDTLARIGQLVLADNPFDPELLGMVLRALRQTGQGRAAQALRREVRRRYAEVGESAPGEVV